jgi:hypothetical protein
MYEKISGITTDLEAGLIISPERLKYLIRVKRRMLLTCEKFTGLKGWNGENARADAASLKEEIAGYEALLAAADDVIAALNREYALTCVGDIERRQELRDMRVKWEAEASGLQHYVRNLRIDNVNLGGRGAGEEALI